MGEERTWKGAGLFIAHGPLPGGGKGSFARVEDLAQIAAINPAAARLASDEVLGFVLRRVADELAMYLPRGDAWSCCPNPLPPPRLTAGASGFLNFSQSGDRPVAGLFETIPPAPSCRYDGKLHRRLGVPGVR